MLDHGHRALLLVSASSDHWGGTRFFFFVLGRGVTHKFAPCNFTLE
jgi:hypothetical protein